MPNIKLNKITRHIDGHEILGGIDLEIDDGEFVAFVGPSGCGKSTLLRILSGLDLPDSGQVLMGDKDVTHLPPIKRSVGMVFQSYALYPQLTVRGNLAFGMKVARMDKSLIEQTITEVAARLQITQLLDRKPAQLSGGQRQRVAIGRALARKPSVLLFDEPLSNLDAALRSETRRQIAEIHQSTKATMIYVTHDQVEAMALATKVVVLEAGKVIQADTPINIFQKPRSRFVAEFIGSPKMNIWKVSGSDNRLMIADGISMVLGDEHGGFSAGRCHYLGVRPHDLSIMSAPQPTGLNLPAHVTLIENLGTEKLVTARFANEEVVVASVEPRSTVERGDQVVFHANEETCHFFDEKEECLAQ